MTYVCFIPMTCFTRRFISVYLISSHFISLYLSLSHFISFYLTLSHFISLYLSLSHIYLLLSCLIPMKSHGFIPCFSPSAPPGLGAALLAALWGRHAPQGPGAEDAQTWCHGLSLTWRKAVMIVIFVWEKKGPAFWKFNGFHHFHPAKRKVLQRNRGFSQS